MKTNSKLGTGLQRILSSKGLAIRKLTDKNSVLSLVTSLHPYATDKNLVRLGNKRDGGYLVPDDLEGISACFSPGIGESSSFELDCVKYGMKVFLADASVNGPRIENNKFYFIKKFIGPLNDENHITLGKWVNDSLKDKDSDLMLEMDIEGHEYLSIVSMPDELLNRFRILVIEFHYLDKLWNPEFFKSASAAFRKILQSHTCVHIHPNNCCGVESLCGIEIPRAAEFTFLRKDRINQAFPRQDFPHPSDFDCTNNKTIILPLCWYS